MSIEKITTQEGLAPKPDGFRNFLRTQIALAPKHNGETDTEKRREQDAIWVREHALPFRIISEIFTKVHENQNFSPDQDSLEIIERDLETLEELEQMLANLDSDNGENGNIRSSWEEKFGEPFKEILISKPELFKEYEETQDENRRKEIIREIQTLLNSTP